MMEAAIRVDDNEEGTGVSEEQSGQTGQSLGERGNNRSQRPTSAAFRAFIAQRWRVEPTFPTKRPVADYADARRRAVAAAFPSDRIVVPAGGLKVRANDTDYRFRPHSTFAHLTGLGADQEPDAVLVIEPSGEGELYFRPRVGPDTEEFFADARYGEFWVGPRPSLDDLATELGMTCRHIDELRDRLAKDVGAHVGLRIIEEADPTITALVDEVRAEAGVSISDDDHTDDALAEFCSELRLTKDEYEIGQLREAIAATTAGFGDIVRALPAAVAHRRGERVIEGAFEARARADGNGLGYETIAAAGPHACTLHWIRNDGPVRSGELVLVDAGVEADSLYTADVTRTLPVNGRFSDDQREVYQAVLDAANAAFAVAKPGARFRDVHAAAMAVIAERLHGWGLLPGTVEESLDPDGQFHRRWMVHGTSHHLGLDVHDCAQARREMYVDKVIEPGMVFTIEPGLYFHPGDELVPKRLRGIGIRIEDDVLITADGNENLSAALPRTPDDVEAWMAEQQA